MNKLNLLKILNPFILLVALCQAGTGFSLTRWGGETLGDFHLGNGILLVTLILIHLILNRDWIMMNYFKRA